MRRRLQSVARLFRLRGRATRREYVTAQALSFTGVLPLTLIRSDAPEALALIVGVCALSFVFAVPTTVRRLHDTGRSGWWLLAQFIPVVSMGLTMHCVFAPGTHGTNVFGEDPRRG